MPEENWTEPRIVIRDEPDCTIEIPEIDDHEKRIEALERAILIITDQMSLAVDGVVKEIWGSKNDHP